MTATVLSPALGASRAQWRRWVGPVVGGLVVLLAVAGAWLASGPGARSLSRLMDDNVLTNAVNGVGIGVIAALLTFLRPANRVGWVLMYAAAANSAAILGEGWALASYHVDLPGRTAMAWLGSWVWATALILGGTVLPAIYPTGRAIGRTARWIVRIGWVCSIGVGVCLALLDDAFRDVVPGHRMGHNPLSDGRFQGPVVGVAAAIAVVGIGLVLFTVGWTVRRLWRARSPEREQLAWLLLAVVPSILVGLVASPPIAFVVNLLTSAALLIGIVRYRLFDIKLVLRSGLVYGLLIALVVAVYLGVVAVINLVTPPGRIPTLFAVAAVALLVRPAYTRLAGGVGRLVYGDRADPVRALTRVGRELAAGDETGTDLVAMVAAVAASVRSPQVSVRTRSGELVAETGSAPGHPVHEVTLRHGGVEVGTLLVAWRTPANALSATDRRLVDALAAPVAVALRAAQLTREVGESRARVLAVRETERRQLRNDLHDGLGPSLSGVALGIEAARKAPDGARAREILDVLHGEVTGLVGEVRHLIDDLGPAALGPGGLVSALRSHAEAVSALGPLAVAVYAEPLPALPGPVEVALHRIAGEALTNVARHADARHATVSVALDVGTIRLLVTDDGTGIGSAPEGVGRASMAERAAALGGTLSVADAPGGGTRVLAEIPLDGGSHE